MKNFFLVLILGFLFSGNAYAENLNLLCKGDGSRKTGTGLTLNKNLDSSVIFNLDNNSEDISIHETLLPSLNKALNFFKKDKKNKFKLYNIKITESEISANFKLNAVNEHSVKIDRYKEILFIEGINLTFSAECKKF